MDTSPDQFGFNGLLQQADTDNRRHRFERASGHLPSEMEAAIRYHRPIEARYRSAHYLTAPGQSQ